MSRGRSRLSQTETGPEPQPGPFHIYARFARLTAFDRSAFGSAFLLAVGPRQRLLRYGEIAISPSRAGATASSHTLCTEVWSSDDE